MMNCDACSNNSINDNRVNAKKARSKVHQVKQLLRPLFFLLSRNKRSYRKNPQPEFHDEAEDNLANELLERRIFGEIDRCAEFAAVPVYRDGVMEVVPVVRGERYVPVHFAKTEAGTFFWTTMVGADFDVDCHGDENAITEKQVPQVQAPCDRWAQA